jgi:DNA-binding NarL/FixJ family response regulator
MQVKKNGSVNGPIRLLVVDDHPLVRKGIESALRRRPSVEIVGEACNGEEALKKICELRPDVVLSDVDLPKRGGLEVADAVRKRFPKLKVILMSAHPVQALMRRAAAARVSCFLLKALPVERIAKAIEDVAAGWVDLAWREGGGEANASHDFERLTEREREVLLLIANGLTNKQIAEILGLTGGAVGVHRAGLRRKLGVQSTAGLTKFAVAAGLVWNR